MKKYLTFLLAAALLLSLTACGGATTPEEDLAACGEALEKLQSSDGYHIATRRDLVEDNRYIEFEHWKSGEDWMNLSRHTGVGIFFAKLHCDDQTFENTSNTELRWEKDIQWDVYSDEAVQMPLWLDKIRWKDQQVRHLLSTRRLGGRMITVQFLTPYTIGDQTAQGYTVDFYLDRHNNLKKAVMTAVFNYETGDTHQVDEMKIVSTDPEKAASKIRDEYARALEQNKIP